MNQRNRPGTKHKSGVERRKQILSSAMKCFIEKGYCKTTMNELVAYTGLSQGAIYHYFSGKDAIVTAILEQFNQHIVEHNEFLEKEGHYLDNLKKYIKDNMEYFRKSYAFSTIVHEIRDNKPLLEQFEQSDRLILDSIRTSIEKIYDANINLNIEAVSFSILAMLEGLFSLSRKHDQTVLEKHFDEIWLVVEHLLAKNNQSAPR